MAIWTWESLYAFMSRERGDGGVLVIHQSEIDLSIESVGEPISNPMSNWTNAEDGPMGSLSYPGSLTYQVSFDDGSHLSVEHQGSHYYMTLFPAPLPHVSWLSDLAPLPWLALPSVFVFFFLVSLA